MSDLIRREQVFVEGRWVHPVDVSAPIEVHDSNSGAVFATVPRCTPKDVDAAVQAAQRALPAWTATPIEQRAAWVRAIGDGLAQRAQALVDVIAREVGAPVKMGTMAQVQRPIGMWHEYAKLALDFDFSESIGNSLVTREPVGVVAAITPWNFPISQISLKVAPALLAGCTVVLKPSELAPLNAFLLAEVVQSAGLPPGVFNLVCGYGDDVGEALVSHSGVDCISFTGSTRAGRRIAEVGARTLKRIRLELGGKSASLILPSADLARATPASIASCYMNSGQTCVAQTRMLVPRERLDEVLAIAKSVSEAYVVGTSLSEQTQLGPLVSQAQQSKVRGFIQQGIDEALPLISGGAEPLKGLEQGYFVRPTVFLVNDPDSALAQEEIFGPVLAVIPYDSVDDAVDIANRTPYGLGGAVWAGHNDEAIAVARRIRTGQMSINGGLFNFHAPFGGMKQSGYGREGGRFGLEEFLEYKSLQLPAATA